MMHDLGSVPIPANIPGGAPRAPDEAGEEEQRLLSSQRVPLPSAPPTGPSTPSLNILPSNQNTFNNPHSSSLPSPSFTQLLPPTAPDAKSPGACVLPQRHPRPLTAADLHLQLEKEQEAVVNRLTRELSILRAAQCSSVVSNASSTSASGGDVLFSADGSSGAGLPRPRCVRHGTSSDASAHSYTANAGSVAAVPTRMNSPAPIRPSQPIPVVGGTILSRENSTASRRSRSGSPVPSSRSWTSTPAHVGSRTAHTSTVSAAGSAFTEASPAIMPATSRYEETALYRCELDSVKRENEMLKRRVRELERTVRDRGTSDAGRTSSRARSSSSSTTASATTTTSANMPTSARVLGGTSIAAQREVSTLARDRPRMTSSLSTPGSVGVGVPEEEVKVGESAASVRVVEPLA